MRNDNDDPDYRQEEAERRIKPKPWIDPRDPDYIGPEDEEDDGMICDGCGEKLDKDNPYHMRFGAHNQSCYMRNIGMSWSDFL